MSDLRDFRISRYLEFNVSLVEDSAAAELKEGAVNFIKDDFGKYTISQGGKYFKASFDKEMLSLEFDHHVNNSLACLVYITAVSSRSNSANMRAYLFNSPLMVVNTIYLQPYDDYDSDKDQNGRQKKVRKQEAALKLQDFVFEHEGQSYFLLVPHNKKPDTDDGTNQTQENILEFTDSSGFTLISPYSAISVKVQQLPNGCDFVVHKKSGNRKLQSLPSVMLCQGNIEFDAEHKYSARMELVKKCLEQIKYNFEGYLKLWEQYNLVERTMKFEDTLEHQCVKYSRYSLKKFPYLVFTLEPKSNISFEKDDLVDISAQIPNVAAGNYRGNNADLILASGKVDSYSQDQMVVNLGEKLQAKPSLPNKGYIFLSLRGDEVQNKRRKTAVHLIKTSQSQMHKLPLLLSDSGSDLIYDTYLKFSRRKKSASTQLSPSARVLGKVFRVAPNTNQFEAIKTALNTPDIALIQGPPGTGKTAVIEAIVESLNENLEKSALQGQILLSGFQHDAVDNLISRIRVNSLPVFKFGSKVNSDVNQNFSQACKFWRHQVISKLQQKYQGRLVPDPRIKQVHEDIARYELRPDSNNARKMLHSMAALPHEILTPELKELLASEKERYSVVNEAGLGTAMLEQCRQLIYALRTDPESFEDDGLINLKKAGYILGDVGIPKELAAKLKSLSAGPVLYQDGGDFFEDLRALQQRLLSYFQPPVSAAVPHRRQSTIDLIEQINLELRKFEDKAMQLRDNNMDPRLFQVLNNFTYELENFPLMVSNTLREYNVILAATVQQSAGTDIIRYKDSIGGNISVTSTGNRQITWPSYDTVIVDEAARSSPIDLLIPMSQARNRIILVGDHNQLPHLVDETVSRRMEKQDPDSLNQFDGVFNTTDNSIDQEKVLKISIFEFLLNRIKKLEEQDGISRIVSLNVQYRMHPVLGKLVSDEFYDGQLVSGLEPSSFSHGLPGLENKYAVWMDLPCSHGLERKQDKSCLRDCEAEHIIKKLKEWLKSPASQGLSFGVICFYRSQIALLKKLAVEQGIALSTDSSSLVLAPEYDDSNVLNRLQIGTVDSFQGKEFDVVFLSTVRSREIDALNKMETLSSDRKGQKQRQVFGHLLSKNRICVAMSRQKRMLYVVGDLAMFQHAEGVRAVPALAKFIEICRKQGTILQAD